MFINIFILFIEISINYLYNVENEPMPKENTEMFYDENGNIIKEIYTHYN